MPAPAKKDAGTASQHVPGVRRTPRGRDTIGDARGALARSGLRPRQRGSGREGRGGRPRFSWALLWLMGWAFKSESIELRVASNAVALSAFSAYLVVDRVPGEPVDAAALAFGGVVFCVFFAVDARWLPRRLLTRIRGPRVTRGAGRPTPVTGVAGRRTR
jgi:hypothetical protein